MPVMAYPLGRDSETYVFTENRHRRFGFSLLASLVLQSACVWIASVGPPATRATSAYVVVPLVAAQPVLYRRLNSPFRDHSEISTSSTAEVLKSLKGPNLRLKTDGAGHRPDET